MRGQWTTCAIYTFVAISQPAAENGVEQEDDTRTYAQTASWELETAESTQELPGIELMKDVLFVITLSPGIDDVEIADRLGVRPVLISKTLREMQRANLVEPL